MTPQDAIKELHAAYCQSVGDLPLTLDRIYWWGQWMKNGWGAEDLSLVIKHIQSEILKNRRYPGALRWSRLIQNAENFGEELILAKAEHRNRKPPPNQRELALQSFRPTVVDVQPKDNTKTASEAAEKALAELRRWKAQEFGEKAKPTKQ